MAQDKDNISPKFGQVKNSKELGTLIRAFRKSQELTLERIYGVTKISTRFLSELERGKETAELGKVFNALNKIGLEVYVHPRGYAPKNIKSGNND